MFIEPAAAELLEQHSTPVPETFFHQGKYLSGAWLAGPQMTVAKIRAAVCRHFGLSVFDIMSDRRTHRIVRPRHILCYLAHILTKHSLPQIGRFLGGRDHSTVHHAHENIARLLATDAQLAADVDAIRRTLEGT